MPKEKFKTVYVCTSCGEASPRWMGRCPSCGEWNTMVEDIVKETKGKGVSAPATGNAAIIASRLKDISTTEERSRIITGISELDRVLGGGIVLGSVVLLSGEPGAGKSTLLLHQWGNLEASGCTLHHGRERNLQGKLSCGQHACGWKKKISCWRRRPISVQFAIWLNKQNPGIVVIDSIQTMHCAEISSSQEACRRSKCTARLLTVAKRWKFPHLLWAMSIRTAQLPDRK